MSMNYFNFRFLALVGLSVLLSACDDKQEAKQEIKDEPVDVVGTEALNAKLVGALKDISREQTSVHDGNNKKVLEQLSEADRQSLIDLTIDSSSKKVVDDANKVLKNSEPQN